MQVRGCEGGLQQQQLQDARQQQQLRDARQQAVGVISSGVCPRGCLLLLQGARQQICGQGAHSDFECKWVV
eukprot:419736-Pelagomonas_calceolata.AAC.1